MNYKPIKFFAAISSIGVFLSYFFFYNLYPKEIGLIFLNPIFAMIFVTIEWMVVALFYLIFFVENRFFKILCHIFMILIAISQTTQFITLYNSQDYINQTALAHAGLVGLLVTPTFIFLSLVSTVVPIIICLYSVKKFQVGKYAIKQKLTFIPLLFILTVFFIVLENNWTVIKVAKFSHQANKEPMVSELITALLNYNGIKKDPEPNIGKNEVDISSLKNYGIFIDNESEYPLIKDFYYKRDLNFKKKYLLDKPNIIVIFTESLNARLIGSYNNKYKSLTPNINKFSNNSLVVKNYYNHVFPTIIGLRGQLCSTYPSIDNATWMNSKFKLKTSKMRCLPEVLSDYNYSTIYLGYSHPNETFFEDQMKDFGFKENYFYDQLLNKYLNEENPERGHYGVSDRQMFASLINLLKSNESKKPFFIALSTIETHPGMDVLNPEQDDFKNISHSTLRLVHNFDTQFGKFITYFNKSKYAKNTIVILTADHAHVPNMDYMKVAGEDYNSMSYFDPITFILNDPSRSLPEVFESNSSSIDFAPTVLQLVNHPNEKNHFLGLSLFSDRPFTDGSLGIITKKRFLLNSKDNVLKENLSLSDCQKMSEKSLACKLYIGLRFTQQLEVEDKIWK